MKKLLFFIPIFYLFSSGCIKKSDLKLDHVTISDWTPDWALPLLNTTLTLRNLLKPNDYVSIDGDGLYSLHYDGKLFSAKASDFISIPDQNFPQKRFTLTNQVSIPSFTGTINDSFSSNFTYTDTNGSRLEHLAFKNGHINIELTSSFNQDVAITVIFPNLIRNGVPFQALANINYPEISTGIDLDLPDYMLDMTAGGTTQNSIPYKVRYTISGTGQPIIPGNSISIIASISNLKFSFIDGYLGRYTIPLPQDTISLNIFNSALSTNIFLENPKVNLLFSNSFGLGMQASFDSLYGITSTGAYVKTIFPNVTIAGATTPGQVLESSYTVDKTNSTIQNIFNPAPNKIIYSGHLGINSSSSSGYSYVLDTSTVQVSLDAELPAYFKIIDFSIQDTTKLIFPKDTNILNKAEFKMLITNSFAIQSAIQLYFADSNYHVVDSLMQGTNLTVIGGAPVDANGKSTGTTSSLSTFVLGHDRYSKMASKVRNVFTRANLKTTNPNSVQIHSSDHVQIKLGIRFLLNATSTDL